MLNPGITGTKRTVDARLNHRMQWVGYDGAPTTSTFSAHGRLFKGKVGAGFSFKSDNVGPAKQTEIGLNGAYHLKFPDVELSLGVGGNYTKYEMDGSKITIHNSQDIAINQTLNASVWVPDASFGLYLYNDRFHLGMSALHLTQSKAEFYKNDTAKEGLVQYVTHANFSLGYNYSPNIDYIFENTLLVSYASGAPITLNITSRLHYKGLVFAGASIRPKDAIALHVGATIKEFVQVSYSYDILTSNVSKYSKGTHEIMLSFSHSIFSRRNRFIHERYSYMFW